MFDNWTYVEWLILIIDILAVVIVVIPISAALVFVSSSDKIVRS